MPHQSQRSGFFGRREEKADAEWQSAANQKPATGLLRSTPQRSKCRAPRTAPNQSQRPGFFGRRVKRCTDCETYQSKPKPATGLLRSTAVVRDHSGDSDNHTKASDRASSVDITDGRRRYCAILDTPKPATGLLRSIRLTYAS